MNFNTMREMSKFYKKINFLISVFAVLTVTQLSAQSGNTCGLAIAIPVNVNQCVYTQVSNAGLTNSGQTPVGASCTAFAGGDLWIKVVVPPSGELTVRAQFKPGVSNFSMDINMAVYSGACGALTLIGCDEDSGDGFYPSLTFTGTPGSTMYVQFWDTQNNQQSPFNVCVNGSPTCVSPTATFAPSCGAANEFNVAVNVTSLGDASSVNITNNAGAPAVNGITSTGVQTVGPFPLGSPVTITVVHADDMTCNVSRVVSADGLTCQNVVTCGSNFTRSYCYKNNDNTAFLYTSADGSDLTLTFNSGLIQSPNDKITIRNGNSASAPILFDGSNGGNLTGVTATGTSGSLYLKVTSDVGGSCADNSLGLGGGWNFTVSCNGTSSANCDQARAVLSKETFAESQISANIGNVTFSGPSQCVGPGGNPDIYFKFTAVASVTYIRVNGGGNFDPVVEVYTSCGGTQLACKNDAPAGVRELFWLTGLTPGQEYIYRVYHAGTGVPTVTNFQTGVAHIPFVRLRADFCGATNLAANSIIKSTQPPNTFLLEAFIWEFTELEPPFNTYEVISPNPSNPSFIIYYFDDFEYGRSYSVRTKVRMYQGPNEGDYGTACTITIGGGVLGSALQPQYNNGFYQLCDILKAVVVPGAVNYRWTFDNGAEVLEYNSNSSNYFLPLQAVNGLQLGTSYVVNVFVTSSDGNISISSVDRTINMQNSVPNTRLNPALIPCGSNVNLTQGTQAFNVCAATSYSFRFTNLSQPAIPVIEKVRPNRAIVFNSVAGLIPGDTYNVAVRASAGGLEGDYSTECQLTINGLMGRPGINVHDEPTSEPTLPLTEVSPTSAVSVYPNPNNGQQVSILIQDIAEEQQLVIVRLYDISGKQIFEEQYGNSGASFNTILNFQEKLAKGFYILRTQINGKDLASERIMVD